MFDNDRPAWQNYLGLGLAVLLITAATLGPTLGPKVYHAIRHDTKHANQASGINLSDYSVKQISGWTLGSGQKHYTCPKRSGTVPNLVGGCSNPAKIAPNHHFLARKCPAGSTFDSWKWGAVRYKAKLLTPKNGSSDQKTTGVKLLNHFQMKECVKNG